MHCCTAGGGAARATVGATAAAAHESATHIPVVIDRSMAAVPAWNPRAASVRERQRLVAERAKRPRVRRKSVEQFEDVQRRLGEVQRIEVQSRCATVDKA